MLTIFILLLLIFLTINTSMFNKSICQYDNVLIARSAAKFLHCWHIGTLSYWHIVSRLDQYYQPKSLLSFRNRNCHCRAVGRSHFFCFASHWVVRFSPLSNTLLASFFVQQLTGWRVAVQWLTSCYPVANISLLTDYRIITQDYSFISQG